MHESVCKMGLALQESISMLLTKLMQSDCLLHRDLVLELFPLLTGPSNSAFCNLFVVLKMLNDGTPADGFFNCLLLTNVYTIIIVNG